MSKIPDFIGGQKGLLGDVWRAAIDCDLTHDNSYAGDSYTGYHGPSGNWPPVAGPTGDITLSAPADKDNPNPPSQSINPWNDVYYPWWENIADAFHGWDDDLPDPDTFGAHAKDVHGVVSELTISGSTQHGGSLTGSHDLVGRLSSINKDLDTNVDDDESSTTISTFNEYYGADVIESTTANVCQPVIVLHLAHLAEQKLWNAARTDIVNLATAAKQAFKAAGAGDAQKAFTACSAVASLVAAFQPEAAPVAASVSFLSAVNQLRNKTEKPVAPELKGGSAKEVYNNLADSVRKLNTVVWQGEDAIHQMLVDAFRMMDDDRKDFVFYTRRGVQPEVREQRQIKVNTGLMREVGYKLLPEVAGVLARQERPLAGANSTTNWLRPPNIGYGSSGPWDEYSYLDELVRGVLVSNANQLVAAGEVLARSAGYLHDTNHDVARALHNVEDVLKSGKTGWPAVDDSSPDTYGWSGKRPPP